MPTATSAPVVAPLTRTQYGRATETLTAAFDADPLFTWLFPDPTARPLALRTINRVALDFGLRYGRVTQAGDGQAVAIWVPPGVSVTTGHMLLSGMLGMEFRVGFRATARFGGANEAMGRIHAAHVPEPHWYLLIVGVSPATQGGGLGSALVADGLAMADAEHQRVYLETSAPRNLPFYERFGFRTVETTTLSDGGPQAWALVRGPVVAAR